MSAACMTLIINRHQYWGAAPTKSVFYPQRLERGKEQLLQLRPGCVMTRKYRAIREVEESPIMRYWRFLGEIGRLRVVLALFLMQLYDTRRVAKEA